MVELLQRSIVDGRVRLLELDRGNIRPGLAELRREGFRRFVVDLGSLLAPSFFGEALKAGIVNEEAQFVLTDLVSEKVNKTY